MTALYITCATILGVTLVYFIFTLVCFLLVFYSPKRKPPGENEYEIPKGDIYEIFRDDMIRWQSDIRKMPHKGYEIKSFDGLTLRANFYEYKKGAPIEILFHGYRGSAHRDLCGAVHRCFHLGRSALIVDHRASGESDGHVITFGIKERRDALGWIDLVIREFGDDIKIMITGISMGAATVMMTLNEPLPKNVVAVLADCGYTTPKEIISKVLCDLHLPAAIFYPTIRLGARIFGGFDLEEVTALEGVEKSALPIIFIHGTGDDFVPSEMSERLYEKSIAKHKAIALFPDVGHGLAFPASQERYYEELSAFTDKAGVFEDTKV